jgi:hypothetical protein
MNNGTKKSINSNTDNNTIKSSVVRKKDKLLENITKEIANSANPLSTSDLTVRLDKAWHTIDRACLMLQIQGKLEGFRVGKMNLWKLKR